MEPHASTSEDESDLSRPRGALPWAFRCGHPIPCLGLCNSNMGGSMPWLKPSTPTPQLKLRRLKMRSTSRASHPSSPRHDMTLIPVHVPRALDHAVSISARLSTHASRSIFVVRRQIPNRAMGSQLRCIVSPTVGQRLSTLAVARNTLRAARAAATPLIQWRTTLLPNVSRLFSRPGRTNFDASLPTLRSQTMKVTPMSDRD